MLELESAGKVYDDGSERVVAVDDLTLRVEEGEFLTLLGPSGCGKTTTLRMIAGFETPTSGSITLGGRDITRVAPQKRDIGMVFQNYALFPHLSVGENVAFGLRTRGMKKAPIAERVETVLKRVALEGYTERRVQQLSGGQQQRVALARALAPEPPLLLLDEPLSNLDAALRERTRAELRALLKRLGITAVFVTHDQDEAFALSDRIALMNGGRLQQLGTPRDLYHDPVNSFVASFLGKANFLPGRVVRVGDSEMVCEVAGRAQWRVRRSPHMARPSERDRVLLMVRPEALTLEKLEGENSDGALVGAVAERRFAGAVTHYRVQTFGAELLVADETDRIEPGTRVRILPRGSVYAFPERRDASQERDGPDSRPDDDAEA